jgi:hypothetical protein
MGHLKWTGLLAAALVCCMVTIPQATADMRVRPQDFQTKGTFDLVVSRSQVLRPGPSTIVTQSAFVTHAHGLIPGNADGLEIQFFTGPLTEAARADILGNGAKQMRKSPYAALVLFLDKDDHVWQVNLSYVIPGTTVARTVAWKPDELRQFADYAFDGTRVRLKSKGTYRETGNEQLTLSWDVDLSLPVFDRITK